MSRNDKSVEAVFIGGKEVPLARAAEITLEAMRRKVPPSQVTEAPSWEPVEGKLLFHGLRLSPEAVALIGEAADLRGVAPAEMVTSIVEDHVRWELRKSKRAKARKQARRKAKAKAAPASKGKRSDKPRR